MFSVLYYALCFRLCLFVNTEHCAGGDVHARCACCSCLGVIGVRCVLGMLRVLGVPDALPPAQ